MSTALYKKSFAEKVSTGVHHLGDMLLIPTHDALDAFDACFPNREPGTRGHNSHNPNDDQLQQRSMSQRIGQMISIPTYDAIEALPHVQHPCAQRRAGSHIHKKVGKFQKMCRAVGAMLSVPICDAAEIYESGSRRGF